MVDGYAELVPAWSADIWSSQHGSPVLVEWTDHMVEPLGGRQDVPAIPPPGYTALLGAANVQYLTSRWPVRDPRLQELPTRERVHFYRNLDAVGRAYLVPDAVDPGSDGDFHALLASGGADLRRHVYLRGQAEPARASFTALPVPVEDTPALTRVTLNPEAPAPCWLVLSDAYYPGWSAAVDGRPAPLARANGAMRAVPLPAGKHRVEFTYRCRPLEIGAVVTGISALLWLAALLLLPRLPQPTPAPRPSATFRPTRRTRKRERKRAARKTGR